MRRTVMCFDAPENTCKNRLGGELERFGEIIHIKKTPLCWEVTFRSPLDAAVAAQSAAHYPFTDIMIVMVLKLHYL